MINELKNKIQIKIKRQIITRGDCHFLSDRIVEELNINISYNTLRRFFRVESNTTVKASSATLNILSKFIGYKTFEDLQKNIEWSSEWEALLTSNVLIDQLNEKAIVSRLEMIFCGNRNFTVVFVSILRELFLLNEIGVIDKIFKNSTFKFEKLTYSEILYIGNGIGSVFRKIKMGRKVYATASRKQKNCRPTIFNLCRLFSY